MMIGFWVAVAVVIVSLIGSRVADRTRAEPALAILFLAVSFVAVLTAAALLTFRILEN